MSENFKNRIITDESAGTDDLQKTVLLIGVILTILIVGIFFVAGKELIAKGFLLGAGISLVYFRMQVLFVKNFAKKDLVSILISVLSGGRIFIIAAILFIAVRRVDVFDLPATITGVVTVHLISFIVFSYNIIKNDKKKLMIN